MMDTCYKINDGKNHGFLSSLKIHIDHSHYQENIYEVNIIENNVDNTFVFYQAYIGISLFLCNFVKNFKIDKNSCPTHHY